eukprot:scaffold8015_cov165-Ochromonas_danica.AAC.3
MNEKKAISTFLDFLSQRGISLPSSSSEGKSLLTLISSQFHKLDDDILRALITEALHYRDDQLRQGNNRSTPSTTTKGSSSSGEGVLGEWEAIIDAMKEVIARRRDLAGENFQKLIQLGLAGNQKEVDRCILLLVKNCEVDYLFLSLLEETRVACQQTVGREEQVYMLTYFHATISKLIERAAAYRKDPIPAPPTPTPVPAPTPIAATTKEVELPPPPTATTTTAAVEPPAPPAPPNASTEEGEMKPDRNDPQFQLVLIEAGDFLHSLLREAAGEIKVVQERLLGLIRRERASASANPASVSYAHHNDRLAALAIALEDNIQACQEAGYVNKEKVFTFMRDLLESELARPSTEQVEEGEDPLPAAGEAGSSSYHAPRFVEKRERNKLGHHLDHEVLQPCYLDGRPLARSVDSLAHPHGSHRHHLRPGKMATMNQKKLRKVLQRLMRTDFATLVADISRSLEDRHWAAVEGIAPLDLIRRVRVEAQLFSESFEQAEIWVGKQADVGAHLTVPSIRGDKVLWLCGGHQLLRLQTQDHHYQRHHRLKNVSEEEEGPSRIGVNSLPKGEEEGKKKQKEDEEENDHDNNSDNEEEDDDNDDDNDDGNAEEEQETNVKLYRPESMNTPRPEATKTKPDAKPAGPVGPGAGEEKKKKEETPYDPEFDPTVPHTANHAAPEGTSRHVKTFGEIEPCKLQIKAKSPLRRFSALKELILVIDTLVAQLRSINPVLAGLYERSDVMLSVYPGSGSRFANHIDNTTQDGRRLTVVTYLNPGWDEALGGALRVSEPRTKRTDWRLRPMMLPGRPADKTSSGGQSFAFLLCLSLFLMFYHHATFVFGLIEPVAEATVSVSNGEDEEKEVDIYPAAGRVAMFYSSEVAHEVMPCYGHRYALTIWYYDRNERLQALAEARNNNRVNKTSHYSAKHQEEAREFIAKLLHNEDRPVEVGHPMPRGGEEAEPSEEELQALRHIVQNELSREAVEIVSSITGAPSPESFMQGFPLLTTKDLQHMRALFRRMGLDE